MDGTDEEGAQEHYALNLPLSPPPIFECKPNGSATHEPVLDLAVTEVNQRPVFRHRPDLYGSPASADIVGPLFLSAELPEEIITSSCMHICQRIEAHRRQRPLSAADILSFLRFCVTWKLFEFQANMTICLLLVSSRSTFLGPRTEWTETYLNTVCETSASFRQRASQKKQTNRHQRRKTKSHFLKFPAACKVISKSLIAIETKWKMVPITAAEARSMRNALGFRRFLLLYTKFENWLFLDALTGFSLSINEMVVRSCGRSAQTHRIKRGLLMKSTNVLYLPMRLRTRRNCRHK